MLVDKERIEQHIQTLSKYTATPGQGVTRLTYSNEDLQARKYIKEKMVAYGLTVHEDGIGNIFGKLEGSEKDAPSVLVGSHFDSVPNGGAYDGAAGVVAGLEVAAIFHEKNITPKYPLEIVALVEEEGTRFGGGLMGSMAMTGLLKEDELQKIKDKNNSSVEEAMQEIGIDPNRAKYRDPNTIKAFLELHIEQGPLLEEEDLTIGVVDAIVGITQLEVIVEGKAGHAGTTPMAHRNDALVTAAKIIAELPELAREEGEGTVITTGRLEVFPNGANVIPDKVVFTIDIRSGKEENVEQTVRRAKELIHSYQNEGIRTSSKQLMYMSPTTLNADIRALFGDVCDQLDIPYTSMNSGAGHDTMVFSHITAAGMIFIPSKDGLSHCPEEWSDNEHIAKGAQVLYEAVKVLAEV